MLAFEAADGRFVRLSPLALTTVLEEQAGAFDFQLCQTGPRGMVLTLSPAADATMLERARGALGDYLSQQGLPRIPLRIRRGALPGCSASGKRPRIVRAPLIQRTPPPSPVPTVRCSGHCASGGVAAA